METSADAFFNAWKCTLLQFLSMIIHLKPSKSDVFGLVIFYWKVEEETRDIVTSRLRLSLVNVMKCDERWVVLEGEF